MKPFKPLGQQGWQVRHADWNSTDSHVSVTGDPKGVLSKVWVQEPQGWGGGTEQASRGCGWDEWRDGEGMGLRGIRNPASWLRLNLFDIHWEAFKIITIPQGGV